MRAEGEHSEFNKTTETPKLTEKDHSFFMRKRGENSIRKWKMIRKFIELTLVTDIKHRDQEMRSVVSFFVYHTE